MPIKPEQKKPEKFPLTETIFAVIVIGVLIAVALQAPTGQPDKLTKFGSYSELSAAFMQSSARSYGITDMMAKGLGAPAPMMATSTQGAANSAESIGGTSDYSKTNVQVEGVDEADIVKSDGKYIYNFFSNKLVITDAYPIESAKIISKMDLNGLSPQEMFVNGDKLVIFGTKYESYGEQYYADAIGEPMMKAAAGGATAIRAPGPMPRYYSGGSNTIVRVYDISNRETPQVEKEFEFNGNYLTSRLIGNNAYFVVNSYPRWVYLEGGGIDYAQNIIPMMKENGSEKRIAGAEEIGYLPPMPAESFVTIASLNLGSDELQKVTIAGNASIAFASLGFDPASNASQSNIYLASTAWLPGSGVPLVKGAESAIIGDSETTLINKFGISNPDGSISFVGQGSVPGSMLNQFSMDEYNEDFRIATTVRQSYGETQTSSNNVYVLDGQMKTIGKLEGLAQNETIYAVRFMNGRGYVVTFNRIDPLFVIDLSVPTAPKVLGELKIPGYSDYLQPYDETHLIGIGKDVDASIDADKVHTPGAIYYTAIKGLKMSLFDVSDVSNPKEISKYIIGERGTDSEALYEHKALLFDKEKQLLVLPVSLHEITSGTPTDSYDYFPLTFDGAYVFSINIENGFQLRGKINHLDSSANTSPGSYYDEYNSKIRRSMYIGNVLYTLSGKMLKANDLKTLAALKEFKFE
ncbi:MAG: beta-propeller domain-containing protein [archaeon]